MSPAGVAFMKAALAPPDFRTGVFEGIPDEFNGKVLTKSYSLSQAMPTFAAGNDSYVALLPVPGYAFFYGQVVAGSITWTGVQYPDFTSFFPAGYETTNASSFRYAGHAMEIIPLVNQTAWSGSVEVYRGPVEITQNLQAGGAPLMEMTGLNQLVYGSRPDAVHPFNMGCYCVARPTTPDFPFRPIDLVSATSEILVAPYSAAKTGGFGGTQVFTGLGAFEAIVYKIPAFSAAGNIFSIRTWANLEYLCPPSSALYDYSHQSPPRDELALTLTRSAFEEIQVCVPFYENDGMWSKVLKWIQTISAGLSFVPGPVGMIAEGVGAVATGLEVLGM